MSADLDDFFAKKDKNRKKKTKGISNEDFVQKYEAKCKDSNNKENKSALVLNNLEGFIQDDGEWKDFEDENKDYSGLKIHALTISDEEQNKEVEEDIKKEIVETPWGKKEDNDENGDNNNDGDDENKEKTDEDSNKLESKQESETKKPSAEEESSDDIVGFLAQALFSKRSKEKGPIVQGPRIDDVVEFPDLGATPEAIEDAKTFQPVKSRVPAPPLPNQHRLPQNDSISTDNKYSALRNNY